MKSMKRPLRKKISWLNEEEAVAEASERNDLYRESEEG